MNSLVRTLVRDTQLADLLPELTLPTQVAHLKIKGVTLDSRQVEKGDLFIALSGARQDGQQFIGDAIARGAVAIAVESTAQAPAGSVRFDNGIPVVAVAKLDQRVSAMAGYGLGDPSAQMKVVGVTGTNGKSTCVSLISQLYSEVVGRAAAIGTLGVSIAGETVSEFGLTTPDSAHGQKLLAQLWQDQVELVAMEVSSHGLDQHRVAGIAFEIGVFTNITRDHLDYHGSIENYAVAKQKLFQTYGLKSAIINLDDPFAQQMVAAAGKDTQIITYSLLEASADVYASNIRYSKTGVEFTLTSCWGTAQVNSPLLGEFNIYNLAAAISAVCASGCDFTEVVAAVGALQPVPGRMQKVAVASDVLVVVDYAHTPDALAQSIAATRVHTSGSLCVVFGCGGDRDKGKRPLMAKVAERYADTVMVTSDNPRTEQPQAIIDEIAVGFDGQSFDICVDRRESIEKIIAQSQTGDVILLAGKGHEKYQIIGEQKHHFDDVEVAAAALEKRNRTRSSGASL